MIQHSNSCKVMGSSGSLEPQNAQFLDHFRKIYFKPFWKSIMLSYILKIA